MRMRATYIAFGAIGLLVLIIQLGLYFKLDDWEYYTFLKNHNFNTGLLVNGYVSTRVALEVGFLLLTAPMVILTFARQVAGEDTRGTLRLILSRPISRFGLINAKFMVGISYCVLLMAFFITLSYGMGVILYGPQSSLTIGRFTEADPNRNAEGNRVQPEPTRQQWQRMTEAEREKLRIERNKQREARNFAIAQNVIPAQECLKRLVLAGLFTSWALVTVGSIALFFSVINRNPISAMALTIGAYFMVMIVQGLASAENIVPLFTKVKPYLFTTAMDLWRECLSFTINWDQVWHDAILLGIYTSVIYAAAAIIFIRKDITS